MKVTKPELMILWKAETKLDRLHRARAFLYLQDVLTEAENNRVKIRIKKKYGAANETPTA